MSENRVGQEIRSCHHNTFRTGQWALITGTIPVHIRDDLVRDCYQLEWPDGATDWWAIEDATAKYEFRGINA